MSDAAMSDAAQTPAAALERLRRGNDRFVSGRMRQRDLMERVRDTAGGQFPFAAVLGCIDSRVPPELVFDQGVGDLMVARVAGNVINTDLLASLEFATAVAGATLVVVLGHTACGAVRGACDGVELGHLPHLLARLAPAVEGAAAVDGPRDSSNPDFLDAVARRNVELVAAEILRRSEVIRHRVERGQAAVVGALHEVSSGRVTMLGDAAPDANAAGA